MQEKDDFIHYFNLNEDEKMKETVCLEVTNDAQKEEKELSEKKEKESEEKAKKEKAERDEKERLQRVQEENALRDEMYKRMVDCFVMSVVKREGREKIKEKMKRQRLNGQSGIGEDFRRWRSDEEMVMRQQYMYLCFQTNPNQS